MNTEYSHQYLNSEMWRWYHFGAWILVVSMLLDVSKAEIYITGASMVPWGGTCAQNCTRLQPCSLSPSTPLYDLFTCGLTFLSGDYGGSPMNFQHTSGVDLAMTIESNVTRLSLTFDLAASNILITSSNQGGLVDSTISFLLGAAATVKITNLNLFDTAFNHVFRSSGFEFQSCYIRNTRPSVVFSNGQQPVSVTFSDTSIWYQTTGQIVKSQTDIYVQLNNVSGTIDELVSLGRVGIFIVSISVKNSNFQATKLYPSDSPEATLNVYNSTIVSVGTDLNTRMLGAYLKNVEIEASTISSFRLSGYQNFTAVSSRIIDCYWFVEMLNTFLLNDVEIVINSPDSSVQFDFSPSASVPVLMRNVSVFLGRARPITDFRIVGTTQFISGSSLTVNRLWLFRSSQMVIDELTITDSIVSEVSDPPTTISPQTQNSIWKFDSITADEVLFNMTNLGELQYRATIPTKGIASPLGVISSPSSLIVFRPDPIAFISNTWYPIVNFSSPAHVQLEPSILAEGYELSFRQSMNRYLDILISKPCFPAIEGFVCIDGVWHLNETTPVIVVPDNAGVIQIKGNITSTTPIVFDGFGSTLNVTGCVYAPSIQVTLGQNLPSGPVTLIQQSKGCDTSLVDTTVHVQQNTTSCNKVIANKDPSSNPSTLTVFLAMDTSECSPSSGSWRWIVLGTVLGAAAITAIAVVIAWKVIVRKKFSTGSVSSNQDVKLKSNDA